MSGSLDAMAYLRKEGKYGNVPRSSVIFWDLNMPRKISGLIKVVQSVEAFWFSIVELPPKPHE